MTKVDLPTPGRNASRRVARRGILWLVFASVALYSCAAGQVRPQESKVLPNDLFCERDDDCEILDDYVYGDCCSFGEETEPYAISRAVAEQRRAHHHAECAEADCGDRTFIEYAGPCVTHPEDWTAVCSGHACRRRRLHFFSSPEVHCGH